MKADLKDLHFRQASVLMAIAQLEQLEARSPWVTIWPLLSLGMLALLIVKYAL
jgi:hypothetical protein